MSDEILTLEAVPSGALEAITRGEIDIQIATAHRFPRSIATFKKRALEMVGLDEETAASCIYSRPVGKENGKPVYAEGLSVRTAEIVGACYGNLRVGAMVIEQSERFVKARGFAHDLESNFASSSEVIESTVDRYGKPFSERMRVVIAKACVAKARRDATFQVVPKALCKPLEIEARRIAIGDATTISKRRAAVMEWVKKLGIPVERVFAALGISGEEDIGLEQLTTLTGLKTAIKDKDITIDEAFPENREDIKMPQPKKPSLTSAPEPPPAGTAGGPGASSEGTQGNDTPPAHQADDKYDALRIALSDASIKQEDFVEGLRAINTKDVPKQAKVVADLREDVIDAVNRDGLDQIVSLIEAKLKRSIRA